MDTREIKTALAARGEELARWLFPAGKKAALEWKVGSLLGEAGESLSICIGGSKAGVWADFATGEKGDNLIELLMQARQLPFADALAQSAQWLGISLDTKPRAAASLRSRTDRRVSAEPVPVQIAVMPDPVAAAWREGVEYLLSKQELILSLAHFRGWPEDFAEYVAGCGAVSLPLYHNERGVAFQVMAPEGERGAMTTRPVGYHLRLKGKSEEKATWRFAPNEQAHNLSIPALPYFLGEFEQARLLVITEGQWDALTFALAAGWLGDGCLWPANVGVIGIRGASGVNPFLRWYERFWPEAANCLLLPDRDGAGSKWFEGRDSFADRLEQLCPKVAVVRCREHKDVNDLYRAASITPEQIAELLASYGMTLETEAAA